VTFFNRKVRYLAGSGSETIYSGSGSFKKFRIRPDPDPDPQHCLKECFIHAHRSFLIVRHCGIASNTIHQIVFSPPPPPPFMEGSESVLVITDPTNTDPEYRTNVCLQLVLRKKEYLGPDGDPLRDPAGESVQVDVAVGAGEVVAAHHLLSHTTFTLSCTPVPVPVQILR
jgi:hypothetical protein